MLLSKRLITSLALLCLSVVCIPRLAAEWDAEFGNPGLEIATVFDGNIPAAGPPAMTSDADGNIYLAGGGWTVLDGTPQAASFAKWTRATREWSTFGNSAAGEGAAPYEMAVAANGDVYVGGSWSSFFDGEASIDTQGVVRWDGTTWSALGDGLAPAPGGPFPSTVLAMAIDAEGNLYVGGTFASAGGVPARNVAKWDGEAWSALGDGLDTRVQSLAFGPDGTLYAGGVFAEGHIRRVARWNGTTWLPMAAGLTIGVVNSFAFDDEGGVYAGGTFTGITDPNLGPNSTTANHVARWNGTIWEPLQGGLNGLVRGLAYAHGTLFAGGQFTASGATPLSAVAAWNGAGWTDLDGGMDGPDGRRGTPWDPNVFHMVISSAEDGVSVVVGGPFDRAGELVANNVARWHVGAGGDGGNGDDAVAPRVAIFPGDEPETFKLVFDTVAGADYEILHSPTLGTGFEPIRSLVGTGSEVTHAIHMPEQPHSFYVIRVTPRIESDQLNFLSTSEDLAKKRAPEKGEVFNLDLPD